MGIWCLNCCGKKKQLFKCHQQKDKCIWGSLSSAKIFSFKESSKEWHLQKMNLPVTQSVDWLLINPPHHSSLLDSAHYSVQVRNSLWIHALLSGWLLVFQPLFHGFFLDVLAVPDLLTSGALLFTLFCLTLHF